MKQQIITIGQLLEKLNFGGYYKDYMIDCFCESYAPIASLQDLYNDYQVAQESLKDAKDQLEIESIKPIIEGNKKLFDYLKQENICYFITSVHEVEKMKSLKID